MSRHTLPELSYSYDALEPIIDEQTMKLHHGKHHQGYVNGLNAAEAKLAEAREKNDFGLVKHYERELAFHGAGHFNHCLFWKNMIPAKDAKPVSGVLKEQIEKDFGSFEAFQKHFSAAAGAVEGSGWGMLVWESLGEHLLVVGVENHQKNFLPTTIPLLVLDVWEHAYYLSYQNRRAEYVEKWWSIVDWENVAENFEKAKGYKA